MEGVGWMEGSWLEAWKGLAGWSGWMEGNGGWRPGGCRKRMEGWLRVGGLAGFPRLAEGGGRGVGGWSGWLEGWWLEEEDGGGLALVEGGLAGWRLAGWRAGAWAWA